RVKLDLLWEEGGVAMDTRNEQRVVFRKAAVATQASTGLFGFGRKAPKPPDAGLEVVVVLPEAGSPAAEVAARGQFFGTPPEDFSKSGERTIVRLLEGIRRALNNVEDRRKHPRVRAAFPLTLFPLHSDGRVERPVRAACHDV